MEKITKKDWAKWGNHKSGKEKAIEGERKEIENNLERLDDLYETLKEEVGSSTMDIVSEIVELEILLEGENNR